MLAKFVVGLPPVVDAAALAELAVGLLLLLLTLEEELALAEPVVSLALLP